MPVELVRRDLRWWEEGATVRAIVNDQSHAPSEAPQVGAAGITRNVYINDKTIFNNLVFPGPGTGNRPPSNAVHRQKTVIDCVSDAALFEGFSPRAPLYPGPTLASFFDVAPPPGTEAGRWDVDVGRPTALDILDASGGVAMILSSGAFAGGIVTQFLNPTNATAPPGYAVVGDGAGGYRFNARGVLGGALTTDIPIVWPVTVDRMATVSFRFLAATATEDMQFRCLVNGVEIFAQDLGDAGAPTPDLAFRVSWRLVVQASAAAGFGNLCIDDAIGYWGTPQIFGGD